MRTNALLPLLLSACVLSFGVGSDPRIACVVIDPKATPITLYNKDDSGQALGNIGKLKAYVEAKGKHLRFAQ